MDVCRTCMTRNNLNSIFSYSYDSEQLYTVTGIAIAPDDGLSQSICAMCIGTIANALDLREISSIVDKKLRILSKMKLKKKNNDIDFDIDSIDCDIDSTDDDIDNSDCDIDHTDHDIDSNHDIDNTDCDIDRSDRDIDSTDRDIDRTDRDIDSTDRDIKTHVDHLYNVKIEMDCGDNDSDDDDLDEIYNRKTGILPENINIDSIVDECNSILKMDAATVEMKVKEEEKKPPIIIQKKNIQIPERVKNSKPCKFMALAVTPYDPNGPVKCKMCFSTVKNARHFKGHARTHFEPEYPCNQCPRKYYTATFLRYHKQRAHGELKRLKCQHCSYRSVDRESLQNHVYAVHTGERPFVCKLCDAAFRRRPVLKQHMRTHSVEKNAQCEICSSMFKSKSQLWMHRQKVHLTNITYHCYLCSVSFKRPLPVKRHIEKTHGIPMDEQLDIKRVKTKKSMS